MVVALLTEARARGVAIRLVGDRIRVEAPRGALAPPLRAALFARREELRALLRREADYPAGRLNRAWRAALARARRGFHSVRRSSSPEELEGAAVLELRSESDVEPPFEDGIATQARELLPLVYTGRLRVRAQVDRGAERLPRTVRCDGCGEPTPEHAGGLCFACDLGIDRATFPTRFLPAAMALRAELGPAGRRGVRVERIQRIAESRASP